MENLYEYFTGLFHQILRSLHQPFGIASDLLDISNPHEYCYVRQYPLYGMSRGKSTAYIYLSTAIHNCSSSGSLSLQHLGRITKVLR